MNNHLTRIVLVAVCLALVINSVLAQEAKGGGSPGSSSCDVVATPKLSIATASPGTNVGIFSRVGNCSSDKKRYTIKVSAVSSCSQETEIASSVVSLDPSQYKLISVTYAIASDTCVGASTVTASVYEGGTLLASQSVTLTIQ